MKRILILTADAGFGHRSAAKAIEDTLKSRNDPTLEIKTVNLLDNPKTLPALRKSQSNYDKIVKEMPQLYEFGYTQSDKPLPAAVSKAGIAMLLYPAFAEAVHDFKPDVIVNTYPLYNAPAEVWYLINEHLIHPIEDEVAAQIYQSIVKFAEKNRPLPDEQIHHIRFVTIITDLVSVHKLWYSYVPDIYCVATDYIRQEAIENDVSPSKIFITGIPVKAEFAQNQMSKAEIRTSLGLDPDTPLVLGIGSKRVSGITAYLDVANHSGFDVQMVMAAGGDETIYQSMLQNDWHVPVKIYNFCNELTPLMLASDLLITKAGGLVTSEALAAGLPLLLIDVLPGQETGNAILVEENQAGMRVNTLMEMLKTLRHLMLEDGKLLKIWQQNAKQLGHPDSSIAISKLILEE